MHWSSWGGDCAASQAAFCREAPDGGEHFAFVSQRFMRSRSFVGSRSLRRPGRRPEVWWLQERRNSFGTKGFRFHCRKLFLSLRSGRVSFGSLK